MLTIRSWGPVVIWASLIFYLSSIPHLEITSEPVGNFLTRKAAHLIEYATLALLIFRAQGYQMLPKAVLLASLYGVTDETHQYFVPSRTPMLADVIFDIVGALLGGVAWKYLPVQLKKLKI